ncbi:NADH-quinone oxidoreductase subunit J [Buchnera aphidicola]|uniref:NADH-quinone oxidoreductase subunit J n=1 Tax=Buchnera aphidicola TaxID=9 RepID=UPI00094DE018|nr:NADH-quinone oxidoreductase subunit J [Buchnera aphidicola]
MVFIFYLFNFFSVFFAILIAQSNNPIYALMYLILLACSIASIFFSIGSFFIGAAEIVLYAGAILVLFLFVVMLMKMQAYHTNIELRQLKKLFNLFILVCVLLLLGILIFQFIIEKNKVLIFKTVALKKVGLCLFGKYIFLVEIASLLLLSASLLAYFFLKK